MEGDDRGDRQRGGRGRRGRHVARRGARDLRDERDFLTLLARLDRALASLEGAESKLDAKVNETLMPVNSQTTARVAPSASIHSRLIRMTAPRATTAAAPTSASETTPVRV